MPPPLWTRDAPWFVEEARGTAGQQPQPATGTRRAVPSGAAHRGGLLRAGGPRGEDLRRPFQGALLVVGGMT